MKFTDAEGNAMTNDYSILLLASSMSPVKFFYFKYGSNFCRRNFGGAEKWLQDGKNKRAGILSACTIISYFFIILYRICFVNGLLNTGMNY